MVGLGITDILNYTPGARVCELTHVVPQSECVYTYNPHDVCGSLSAALLHSNAPSPPIISYVLYPPHGRLRDGAAPPDGLRQHGRRPREGSINLGIDTHALHALHAPFFASIHIA